MVNRATLIPPATRAGEILLLASMASNAPIIPITVPINPSIGARAMNNEMIKIDMLVSSALELRPDIERVARAENFVEDGKIDTRRD